MRLACFSFLLVLTLAFFPLRAVAQDPAPFEPIDLHTSLSADSLAAQLADKRVVFIGETHNRYDHHLNQLALIKRLHTLDPNLVLGVEFFQQSFQPAVDDYTAGRTTEQEFLRAADYYEAWGWDYRLYAPIFRFAREQRIPVRALNVPRALPSAVAKVGLAGLAAQQRASLPKDIGPADEAYRSRLRQAFEMHGKAKPDAFEHFVEAQLVWDEGMAESAAAYFNTNQGRRMVILAGSGHLAFGAGIPKRLERRTNSTYAIVLSSGDEVEPRMADYLLLSEKQELPPSGVLGIRLGENGEPRIRSVSAGGAGEKAGLKKGDVLVEIDGQTVKKTADMRVALWDKNPGDRVRVSVQRGTNARTFEIELSKQ